MIKIMSDLNEKYIGKLCVRNDVKRRKGHVPKYTIIDLGFFDETCERATFATGVLCFFVKPANDSALADMKQDGEWLSCDIVDLLPRAGSESHLDTQCWKKDLTDLPDNMKLPEIVTLLMALQYDKEKGYGSSWKGKGEYRGIMSNIDRKYDRLDNMTNREIEGRNATLHELEIRLAEGSMKPEEVSESKIDAISDLTNYGLLYMTWVRDQFPLVFQVWVDRNIPQYLRDNIPFLQED